MTSSLLEQSADVQRLLHDSMRALVTGPTRDYSSIRSLGHVAHALYVLAHEVATFKLPVEEELGLMRLLDLTYTDLWETMILACYAATDRPPFGSDDQQPRRPQVVQRLRCALARMNRVDEVLLRVMTLDVAVEARVDGGEDIPF